jgi:hypothetical protein
MVGFHFHNGLGGSSYKLLITSRKNRPRPSFFSGLQHFAAPVKIPALGGPGLVNQVAVAQVSGVECSAKRLKKPAALLLHGAGGPVVGRSTHLGKLIG